MVPMIGQFTLLFSGLLQFRDVLQHFSVARDHRFVNFFRVRVGSCYWRHCRFRAWEKVNMKCEKSKFLKSISSSAKIIAIALSKIFSNLFFYRLTNRRKFSITS